MTTPPVGTPEHAKLLTRGAHPGIQSAMAWLAYSHLPANLQPFSEPLYRAGMALVLAIDDSSAELTTALNKLVESKDSAVRAGIRYQQGEPGPVPRPATVVDPPAAAECPADASCRPDIPCGAASHWWEDAPKVLTYPRPVTLADVEKLRGGFIVTDPGTGTRCEGCGKALTPHGFHAGTGNTACAAPGAEDEL